MALLKDKIRDLNPVLATLTDEQLVAIETASLNDEDAVIHKKRGEWYKTFDEKLLETSGIEKLPGEKASDYLARVTKQLKEAADAAGNYQTEINSLKEAKTALEKQISEGDTSAATKKQLKDLNDELASLKDLHKKALEDKDKEIQAKSAEMQDYMVESEFGMAVAGLEFKETDAMIKKAMLKEARESLLAEATMDTENGRKVWRDKDGNILRNPQNNNEPFTTIELLAPKLAPILDTGREVKGPGIKPDPAKPQIPGRIVAKTQVEFTEKATDYLIAKGVERGTEEFTKQFGELRAAHKASELPLT